MANRTLLTLVLPPRTAIWLRHEAFGGGWRSLRDVVAERLQHGLELHRAKVLDLSAVSRFDPHWDMLTCLLSAELFEELRHRAWSVRLDRGEFAAYLVGLSYTQRPLHATAHLP